MGRTIRYICATVIGLFGVRFVYVGIVGRMTQPKYASMEYLAIAFGIVLVLWALRMFFKKPGVKPEAAPQAPQRTLDDHNEEIIARLAQGPLKPIQPQGLTPQAREIVYLQQQANAYTVHTVTTRRGTHAGVSIPVGHGIRVNTGAFQSAPASTTGFAHAGSGTLYLTSQRIVFISGINNIVIQRSHILNIEAFKDGARIDVTSGKPIIFITGDIWLYAVYQALLEQERGTTNPT